MPLSLYDQEGCLMAFSEEELHWAETTRMVTRRYLSIWEVRRLHQSPGSPILTELLAALHEPFEFWISEDLGVDEDGLYEVLEQRE